MDEQSHKHCRLPCGLAHPVEELNKGAISHGFSGQIWMRARVNEMIGGLFGVLVELLFKAYVEPAIVEQWMGTKVLKLENKKHGSYQFETTNAQGEVVFRAHGVIHEVVPNQQTTRIFEIENPPESPIQFSAQLEFLEFKKLTERRSELRMLMVFRSVSGRDKLLKLPFAQGINSAHNRLQTIVAQYV